MKKKRFTEEQIAYALAQESTGQTIAEICRKLGVSKQTFYRWKRKFGSVRVAEVRRLKQLEGENAKLRRRVADLSLDKNILQDVLRKRSLTPGQRRGLVEYARDACRVTERARLRIARRRRGNLEFVAERLQCSVFTQRPGHADPRESAELFQRNAGR